MRILVLGGTRFVGRHIVERLSLAHQVTCFHRGQTNSALPAGARERLGDRNADLDLLRDEQWDAIVDVNAYEPDQVERSLTLAAKRYVFISTVNVYRDVSRPGTTESSPTITDFDANDEAASYGGKKAACERVIFDRYSDRATILRLGMVAGRWDHTGRFTYWCQRAMRGGDMLVPGPPDRLVQFIDARDVADFAAWTIDRDLGGVFNVVGPRAALTIEAFIDDCCTAADPVSAAVCRPIWADEPFLLGHGVEPWLDMPLWLPDPLWAGVMQISNANAIAAGLTHHSPSETIQEVCTWLRSGDEVKVAGLNPDRERELLSLLARSSESPAPVR